MSFGHKKLLFALSAMALGSAAAVMPMATGFAAENADSVVAEGDAELLASAGIEIDPPEAPAEERVIDLERQAEIVDRILAEDGDRLPPIAKPAEADVAANTAHDAELDCLAKVIAHEARGEPRAGQLAVAQVVMNRVASPRFPNSICGVVNQRAQFTNIRSFHPRRSGPRWQQFVEIAIDARNDVSDPVVDEALYFHASRIRPTFSHRLTRLGQIGQHIFYR